VVHKAYDLKFIIQSSHLIIAENHTSITCEQTEGLLDTKSGFASIRNQNLVTVHQSQSLSSKCAINLTDIMDVGTCMYANYSTKKIYTSKLKIFI
jgi:hypothetical protein